MSIDDRIRLFRTDLPAQNESTVVQRHITHGECFNISPDTYFSLKARVAQQFGIHPSEVIVVGSAKLGFSIAPDKRYRPFGETSDIDVALCSGHLFDAFWKDVFDYWARGEIWSGLPDFRKYIFRGWMRPDKLPPTGSFNRSREWWEFFRSLTSSGDYGPYKITGALYKSWHFLESYQLKCVRDCKASEQERVQ
jgi:hypothetical protein